MLQKVDHLKRDKHRHKATLKEEEEKEQMASKECEELATEKKQASTQAEVKWIEILIQKEKKNRTKAIQAQQECKDLLSNTKEMLEKTKQKIADLKAERMKKEEEEEEEEEEGEEMEREEMEREEEEGEEMEKEEENEPQKKRRKYGIEKKWEF